MRKQFWGNVESLCLLLVCMVVCSSAYGMDGSYDFVIQQAIIPNVDHCMQRIFAVLNRTYDKMIKEHYRPDKKRIEYLMREKGTPIIRGQASWNKDFSRCAWATIGDLRRERHLKLVLVGLADNRDIVIRECSWYGCYISPVINDIACPLFTKEGDIFCYGYGYSNLSNGSAVIEYSLNFNNEMKRKICIAVEDKNSEDYYIQLPFLLDFPILIKAILQSTKVSDMICSSGIVQKKIALSGVILPEDYKLYKKHPYANDGYRGLLGDVNNIIDQRYEEQQREKMMIEKK